MALKINELEGHKKVRCAPIEKQREESPIFCWPPGVRKFIKNSETGEKEEIHDHTCFPAGASQRRM